MTHVRYKWTNGDEFVVFKTLKDAKDQVAEYGGSYRLLYEFTPSKDEGYCMKGAAKASDRWKNYKF